MPQVATPAQPFQWTLAACVRDPGPIAHRRVEEHERRRRGQSGDQDSVRRHALQSVERAGLDDRVTVLDDVLIVGVGCSQTPIGDGPGLRRSVSWQTLRTDTSDAGESRLGRRLAHQHEACAGDVDATRERSLTYAYRRAREREEMRRVAAGDDLV